MRPLVHKRISKDSYDKVDDESFSISYHSSALFVYSTAPPSLRSSRSHSKRPPPQNTSDVSNDIFTRIITIIAFILILLWLHCQYQLIPSSNSADYTNYTKEFHGHQTANDSVSSVDYTLFTRTLHAKCTYAYLHSSSHIGDIHLTSSIDDVSAPFLQFLTLSDYGIIKSPHDTNNNIQSLLHLIDTMNSHLDSTHFIISAGDIFYDNNVYSAHHPRWSSTFKHFMQNKMFVAVVGNKDWANTSAINAQMQRTNWVKNWCLPKLYYTMRFVFHHSWTNTVSFAVRFIALDTTSYLTDYSQEQYKWLHRVLEANRKDDWVIVYGHHPFESLPKRGKGIKEKKRNGDYGFEELQNMNVWKQKMEPILKLLLRYDNVMYISGHHHIWRVCNVEGKLLTMITGSAGRHNHPFDEDLPVHMVAGGKEESFGKITIEKHRLRVQIIDKQNHTLFNQFYSNV